MFDVNQLEITERAARVIAYRLCDLDISRAMAIRVGAHVEKPPPAKEDLHTQKGQIRDLKNQAR